jgi:hypothetical protein
MSNSRNVTVASPCDIEVLNARKIIDHNTNEPVTIGPLNYAMRFCLGSQRAVISGTAPSAFYLSLLIQEIHP